MHKPLNAPFIVHSFADLGSAGFCAEAYSRLKFGSDPVAKQFGYEMADLFFQQHRAMLLTQRCVVIPSAFNVVEIAATLLARHFMNRLNDLLVRAGGDIVEWTTMHRTVSYLNDYADVSLEERQALLGRDNLYIKEEFIVDKTLIFIDDIQITGTHEHKILKFLEDRKITSPALFCYYAKYTGDRASIEGDLNRSGIGSLTDFVSMWAEEPTHIMVRTLRLWLLAEPSELAWALDQVTPTYIDQLYHATLARGYYTVPELRGGFEAIRARHDSQSVHDEGLIRAA